MGQSENPLSRWTTDPGAIPGEAKTSCPLFGERIGRTKVVFAPTGRIPSFRRLAPWPFLWLGCWTAEIAVTPDTQKLYHVLFDCPRWNFSSQACDVLSPGKRSTLGQSGLCEIGGTKKSLDLHSLKTKDAAPPDALSNWEGLDAPLDVGE